MFNRRIQHNKSELTLFKGRNQYDKVMKEMNEPPKEYEAIKLLVEDASQKLASIRDKDNNLTNNLNLKPKNNIQMKSHNKSKNKK